jgi:hypothetical protein
VVIGNFNIERISVPPAETDSPLVVYADAVLARPIAPKRLQSIPRGNSKRFQIRRGVQHEQFHMARPLDILRQSPRKSTMENLLRFFAGERLYHDKKILTAPVINVKQSLCPFLQCWLFEIVGGVRMVKYPRFQYPNPGMQATADKTCDVDPCTEAAALGRSPEFSG